MRTLILLLCVSCLIYCNGQEPSNSGLSKDLIAGELIYNVSRERANTDGWELNIKFDSTHVKISEEYLPSGSTRYICDKASHEILVLISELKEKFFTYYTPEELLKQSSNYGDTVLTTTQEFKDIFGYKCQKKVLRLGDQATVELWTTDKIRTGIILPGTPLSFENIALEYELKILGSVDCRYSIKSISSVKIPHKEFEHIVPDEYKLIVPVFIFSLDSMWANDYKGNKFKSFQYPSFYGGREAVKEYLREGLAKIVKYKKRGVTTVEFTVSKDGILKDIRIDFERKSKYSEKIKEMLLNMPKWIPATVKGNPVNSDVTIWI